MQKFQKEVDSRVPLVQAVNQSAHELITLDKDPRRKDSPVVSSLDNLNKDWQDLSVQLMNASYKYNEIRERMIKYHSTRKDVLSWFELIEARLINLPPFGIDPKSIKKQMSEQQVCIVIRTMMNVMIYSSYETIISLLSLHLVEACCNNAGLLQRRPLLE